MKCLRYNSKGTRSKRKKLDIIEAVKTVMVEWETPLSKKQPTELENHEESATKWDWTPLSAGGVSGGGDEYGDGFATSFEYT